MNLLSNTISLLLVLTFLILSRSDAHISTSQDFELLQENSESGVINRKSYDENRRNLLAQPTSRPTAFSAPTPYIISAVLSSDGRYCSLTFNTPTNKAGSTSSSFSCSQLLNFDGNNVAICLWQDSSTIAIYPDLSTAANIAAAINVGTPISLLSSNNIYSSACTKVTRGCNAAPAQTIFVLGPLVPTQPKVSIVSSKYISACSPWRLDFTGSQGDGQRGWNSVDVSVVTSPANATLANQLKTYISSQFTTTVPMSIPQSYLKVGSTYNISVTLCNVFFVCDSESFSVTVTNSASSAPVVGILGASGTIRTNAALTLTANSYVIGCGGTTSSVGLTYSWSVSSQGSVVQINNAAAKSNQFVIPAYSLSTGNTYTVVVTVTDKSTNLKSTTSVTFTIQPSPLVAAISPSTMQLLRPGKSITLSGQNSKDPDDINSENGDMMYSWSCLGIKIQNQASSTCFLTFTSTTNQPTLSFTADSSAVNSTSQITLFVSKGSKNATATVLVKVIEGSAPMISIQTTSGAVTQINPSYNLLLSGLVQSDYSVSCSWASASSAISLDSKVALTPTTKSVPANTPTLFSLYLAGNSLPVRSSFQFVLSCARSSASIVVTTNGPPVGGIFSVSPLTGLEMTDTFQFTTNQWSDPDLPITYLFGFVSPTTGGLSTVQSRSVLAYAGSTLPGGLQSSGFAISTIVQAFDNLNASVQLNSTVVVTPLPATKASDQILSQLSASADSTNLDQVRSLISVASAIVSRVECGSATPTFCATLNRESCLSTAGTCGACLTNFVGQAGDGNSKCVSAQDATSTSEPKTCPNDCSSHGVCTFYDSVSGLTTSTCSIVNSQCTASCVCSTGYTGTDCSLTPTELASQQSLRSTLLSSLSSVVNNEDATADSVTNVVSSLSGIVKTASDVNADAVNTFTSIATTTLANSLGDSTITSDMLSGLLGPANAAMNAQAASNGSAAALSLGNQVLSAFTSIASRDSAVGVPAQTYLQDNFRVVEQTFDSSAASTYTVPQTPAELAAGTPATSIQLQPNAADNSASLSIQTVQYNANLLSANASKYSNIVSTTLSNANHSVLVTLSNIAGVEGPSRKTAKAHNFTTFCGTNDFGVYTYTCPGSGKVLTHKCHGIRGALLAYCPVISTVCGSVDLSTGSLTTQGDYTCNLVSMTAKTITCSCSPNPNRRRRLDTTQFLQNTGLLTSVVITQYTAYEVGDTFAAAPELTSPQALQRALIVIVMFSLLWAGGLFLIFVCFIRQRQLQQETMEKKLEDGRKAQQNSENSSLEEVRERLVRYVDSVFPVIFYPGHLLLRLKDEIRRNHRYLMMFMLLEGELEGKKRLINGIQLLTIQSALMFLLALLYDLQQPQDDGTCPTFLTEHTCLARKSIFDSQKTYCLWDSNPASGATSCSFNNYSLSFKATIYIQVIVSVMSALIMRPLYYLFDILLAPNVDNVKAKLAEEAALKSLSNIGQSRTSMIGRMTRRVGRVANSVASMIKFAQPKQVDSKELENMPITLIPDEVELVHNQAQAYFRRLTARSAMYDENTNQNDQQHNGRRMRFTMINKIRDRYSMFVNNSDSAALASRKFDELRTAILKQRAELQPEEVAEFDRQWGLDNNGNFVSEGDEDNSRNSSRSSTASLDASRFIQKELVMVERESKEMLDRLHLAMDSHIGLEILHKFILDILGRETPAGVIFGNKTEEDFRRTAVKTRTAKILAAVAIFGANALFVYYSILRGYVKGVEWQKSYLIACLVQMMLEIYLFETIECVWINVFVPSLVSSEVQRVNNLLLTIINDLCTKVSMGLKLDNKDSSYSLNVPDFLFVSTRVANKHPSIMESMIIRAYHTHLPGELGRKWTGDERPKSSWLGHVNHRGNVSLPAAMVGSLMLTLQFAAMTPFEWQKMFIRFAQPFFYGGLVLLGRDIVSSPIYIAITAFVLFLIVAFLVYSYYRYELDDSDNRLSKISPVSPVPAEEDKMQSKDQMFVAVKKEMDLLKRNKGKNSRDWQSESKSQSRDSDSTSSDENGDKEYNVRTVETTNNRAALPVQKRLPSGMAKGGSEDLPHTFQPASYFRNKGQSSMESSVEEKSDNGSYLLSSTEHSHQMKTLEESSVNGLAAVIAARKSPAPAAAVEKKARDQESEEDDEEDVAALHQPAATKNKRVRVPASLATRSSNPSGGQSVSMESFSSFDGADK